jgi:hypothetical protein
MTKCLIRICKICWLDPCRVQKQMRQNCYTCYLHRILWKINSCSPRGGQRNFAKVHIAKCYEISRNFCHEIKFWQGKIHFEFSCISIPPKRYPLSQKSINFCTYVSGSVFSGTDTMIRIRAKISLIWDTGKKGAVIMTSCLCKFN